MSDSISKNPVTFDWIAARSRCSIQQMFEDLKLAIKQDVELITARNAQDVPVRTFRITERAKFMKIYEEDAYSEYPPSVTFSLSGNAIRVGNGETNEELFNIVIGLNDDGDCNFIVEGQERDSWQVRRQALEGLFFRA